MIVTVWHENPRELYEVIEGVNRVDYGVGDYMITLYSDATAPPGSMIAQFGPAHSWAIEAEPITA